MKCFISIQFPDGGTVARGVHAGVQEAGKECPRHQAQLSHLGINRSQAYRDGLENDSPRAVGAMTDSRCRRLHGNSKTYSSAIM